MTQDELYMHRALTLARKGEGWTSPNPMVGAVIVKENKIIAEGYHRVYGGPHAEINAINASSMPLNNASFYVTLEPCSHYGKTPPCVEAILKLRPAEVVIGTPDPNPLVAGRGIAALKRKGILTRVGILENECKQLNEKFFKYIRTSIPFVTVKFAQSLDGRIATAGGDSQWISSLASRKLAHKERALHDAVLVGIGTVLADDPELTVRHVRGKNPIRVVLDSKLRIPLSARVLQNQDAAKTIIVATTASATKKKRLLLEKLGIEILLIETEEKGKIDLDKVLVRLGQENISSLLVEGGSEIITSFIKQGLGDRLLAFIAPKLIGKGIEAIGNLGIAHVKDAVNLEFRKIFRCGPDVVMDAKIVTGG